ncbi:carbohydrate ABC transporter permease [Paenibacillus eucommiae]|uniref:Aldouronate transport system permease protein n=1 Tax=Paenibacillus eucommiae TaxID=1355755 RepID=A0ABS4IVQ3_9BACL|nr:carbohydrate ABC transporter permease [Paenibacillus eucommiae]MBP1991672.1 putative aldouronate transport system permease protein [Paenibacillus eucommiae]
MATVRKNKTEKTVDVLILLVMLLVIVVTLYPFIYVVSMSISEPKHVINNSVWLWPKGFSLEAYKRVFENPDVWQSYYNTLFYTIVGTAVNVAMTLLGAYPLARKEFFLRNQIMVFIIITMFFNGGMIPLFLLIKNIGLYDTRWALILPVAVGVYFIIITRTFLQGLPESLQEAAKLEGANDIQILYKIIVPLSMPIIAVLSLFYAVGHWNSYFSAMLYLSDPKLHPMSLYLVKILVQNSDSMVQEMAQDINRTLYSVQIKYALIIVTILPILFVYPVLQKYFVKGVLIGSLKG